MRAYGLSLARRFLTAMFMVLALTATVSVPVVAAHGEHSGKPSIGQVKVVGWDDGKTHYGYTLSRTWIPAGLTRFTFINAGTQDHEAVFFKLNKGVTEDQLIATLEKNDIAALFQIASAAGGVASLEKGFSGSVILNMAPGHYVITCFDANAQGIPHFALGMHKSFYVTGSGHDSQSWDRDDGIGHTDGVVTLKDFSITLPKAITHSRPLLLKVSNLGPQTHQMQLLRVTGNYTISQVKSCLANLETCQIPTQDYGGMNALAPHTAGWVELHLPKGLYVAICFVPDVNSGAPHAALGMYTVFQVR